MLVIVALAKKTARIACAVMTRGEVYGKPRSLSLPIRQSRREPREGI
jgi:hypothetical protein